MIDALTFWSVVGGLGSAGVLVIGAVWRHANGRAATLFRRIDEIRQDAAEFKVKVAEEYVSRAALKDALLPLQRQLDRIEEIVKNGLAKLK